MKEVAHVVVDGQSNRTVDDDRRKFHKCFLLSVLSAQSMNVKKKVSLKSSRSKIDEK